MSVRSGGAVLDDAPMRRWRGAATSDPRRSASSLVDALDALDVRGDGWRRPLAAHGPAPTVVGASPEVPADGLGASVLAAALASHGHLVVRGVASAAQVAAAREAIDAAIDGRDAHEEGRELIGDAFLPHRPDGESPLVSAQRRAAARQCEAALCVEAAPSFEEVLGILAAGPVPAAVAGVLGADPAIALQTCLVRRVPLELPPAPLPDDLQPGWHQDGWRWGGCPAVDVWMPFTTCGGRSGVRGLELVPRPMTELVPWVMDADRRDEHATVVRRILAEDPPCSPELAAGDAVLFDSLLLHRSQGGHGFREIRYSAETWFFDPARFPEVLTPMVLSAS